jgi:hypothetical protein
MAIGFRARQQTATPLPPPAASSPPSPTASQILGTPRDQGKAQQGLEWDKPDKVQAYFDCAVTVARSVHGANSTKKNSRVSSQSGL